MQALVTNYYETAAMILFSIGFTMLLLQKNLIKKAIGLNIMDMSVYLFLAAKGYIAGGRAPIADGRTSVEGFINPLPSGLVLTGIVVSDVAITLKILPTVCGSRPGLPKFSHSELAGVED